MRVFAFALAAALAASAAAQSPRNEVVVTGEHRMVNGDTPDSARQLALVDAQRKAVAAAVARLQSQADVKALAIPPLELHAYTAVWLELEPAPDRPATGPQGSLTQVNIRSAVDPAAAVRHIEGLRKDSDAGRAVVKSWTEIEQLHQQLADQTKRRASQPAAQAGAILQEQLQTVTALRAKLLAARAVAALARTEERTTGGSAPSDEARQRARTFAELAVALAPESPDARYAMGDVLVNAELPVPAEAEYRKALALDPASVRGRIKLAEALRLQGKFDESIAELRETIRRDAGSALAHVDLAIILAAQKQFPEAMAEYREAIRLDPASTDAHNGLAIAFARQGNLKAAVEEFREVVRIDPNSAIGYYNLAYALADLDLDVESAAALREVIRINPNHYNARFNLGELFRLEGKYDESAAQFREFLRLAPDTPQNRRNITRAQGYIKEFGN